VKQSITNTSRQDQNHPAAEYRNKSTSETLWKELFEYECHLCPQSHFKTLTEAWRQQYHFCYYRVMNC